ncbi:hypothetical protein HAX54_010485, partial [Datura stramonium]|nr:hypothetical protein [Datura stramonium]
PSDMARVSSYPRMSLTPGHSSIASSSHNKGEEFQYFATPIARLWWLDPTNSGSFEFLFW